MINCSKGFIDYIIEQVDSHSNGLDRVEQS
jgi:hypothetical protein